MKARVPHRFVLLVTAVVMTFGAAGCFEINLPQEGVLGDYSFVVKGEAIALENNGACIIWQADDGRIFALYQIPRIPNATFDAVATVGQRSRLELRTRTSLAVGCREQAVSVEVHSVLEIVEDDAAG